VLNSTTFFGVGKMEHSATQMMLESAMIASLQNRSDESPA
jgi:hypothetical protein